MEVTVVKDGLVFNNIAGDEDPQLVEKMIKEATQEAAEQTRAASAPKAPGE